MSCNNCSSLLPLDQSYNCLCSGESCKENYSKFDIKHIQKAMRRKCSQDACVQGSKRFFRCTQCPQYNKCKVENDIKYFNMSSDEIGEVKKTSAFEGLIKNLDMGKKLRFSDVCLIKDKGKYVLELRRGDIIVSIYLRDSNHVSFHLPNNVYEFI